MLPRCLRAFLAALLLCAPGARAAVSPPTAPLLSAGIPPQTLAAALKSFEEQTGLQGLYLSGIVADRRSKGAQSGLAPAAALSQLLRATGLKFEFLNERTFTVFAGRRAPAAVRNSPPAASPDPMEQIIITGTRGGEPAARVPLDVYVWTQDTMQASGIKSLADIGALTPGVEFDFFSSVGSGVYTNVAIRGITDRHGSATGIFFDEFALPAARSNTFGRALPFYFDLNRVEVLRGPQGTLLGADTQGGAVRFIPNQPSLTEYTGLAHAEWAVTARGGPSYEAGAASGGPLVGDVLGYRLSAWYRSDGGYVDRVNPFTGSVVDASSNGTTSQSARGALIFAPSASLLFSPALSYVSSRAHDSPAFFTYLSNPAAGELNNGSLVPQPFDDTFYQASLKIDGDVGWGALRSLTAYYHRAGNLTVDDTESVKWSGPDGKGWGNPLGPAYPVSYSNAVVTYTRLRQSVVSQELRLTPADSGGTLSWLAGAWYSRTRDTEAYRVAGQFIPVLGGPLDSSNSTTTVQTQFAGFGQVTWLISARTALSAGLRIEHEQYDSNSVAPPVANSATNTLVIPKISLSYEAGGNTVWYATAARGYAPAGVDAALPTCFENPSPYPTDTVWSYELGSKLGLLGGRIHLGATVFDARWSNGPDVTGNCLVTHVPGTAVSRGFELAAQGWLSESRHVRAALTLSYIDAHYTDTVRAGGVLVVNSGDALGTPPVVTSPWNVTASLERGFALRERLRVTLRAEDVFHSRNPGPFYTGIPPPSPYYAPALGSDPSTNVVNLRAAVTYDNLEVALFLDNALDAQPTLLKRNKGVDVSTLFYATTFRPRTLELAGTWHF